MNYEKLFKDKKEGLVSDEMALVYDNDCGWWRYDGKEQLTDEQIDEKVLEYEEKYGRPKGYEDVVLIMLAAGFNAEWC